jgi:hypothetical protein
MRGKLALLAGVIGAAVIGSRLAAAQYPKVPKAVQSAEDERRAAYEKPEDEAWVKAQPELAAWAKKGKPYTPGRPALGPTAGGHPGVPRGVGRRDVQLRRPRR